MFEKTYTKWFITSGTGWDYRKPNYLVTKKKVKQHHENKLHCIVILNSLHQSPQNVSSNYYYYTF